MSLIAHNSLLPISATEPTEGKKNQVLNVKPSASSGGSSKGPGYRIKIPTFPPSVSVVLSTLGSRSQLDRGPLLNTDLVCTSCLIVIQSANCERIPQVLPIGDGSQVDGLGKDGLSEREDDKGRPTYRTARSSLGLR